MLTTATTPTAFNVLRPARSDEVVLAADFSAAGRPTATFTELVEKLTVEVGIWETTPPPYGEEVGMTGADQVRRWTDDLARCGVRVRAVLGFCTGSVYGGAIATRLSRGYPAPLQVLIDPEPADRSLVCKQYEELVAIRLRTVLRPAEVDAALAAGRAAEKSATGLRELAVELAGLCRRFVEPGLVRMGMPAGRATEFVNVFVAYLVWFGATADLDPWPGWRDAVAINGNSPEFGLNPLPPAERTMVVARAIWADVPHHELMRDDGVARTVQDLLRDLLESR